MSPLAHLTPHAAVKRRIGQDPTKAMTAKDIHRMECAESLLEVLCYQEADGR